MNKLAALSVLAIAGTAFATGSTPVAGGGLIISEIVDGTESGGLPKFVELTNTGTSSVDLSNFSIGNFNNGGTNLGGGSSTQLAGTLAPGASWVISYEFSDGPGVGSFFDVYGFDPDDFQLGAFINGDDAVALFSGNATGDGSDATIVDVYGVVGVDGTGEDWETMDSYGFRDKSVIAPNGGVFNSGEWFFAGANALDGVGPAGIVAATTPGSHTWVPAPGAAALLGLAGFAGIRRRRA